MASPDHPFYVRGLHIPRFLFRGFNKYSGGGFPGQNTTDQIVPLAFLKGFEKAKMIDRTMDPSAVRDRVKVHCCQKRSWPTPFSSWSHDWGTALAFADQRASENSREWHFLEEGDESYIAILDTWVLGDENLLQNRIFHMHQFGIPEIDIPCEWLIWGPVSGPAYRCVSFSTIREAVNCRKWPSHLPLTKSSPNLILTEVHDSMLIARCFQREDDASDDFMLAVAAAELACRFWGKSPYISPVGDPETDTEPLWPPDVLEILLGVFELCEPVLSDGPLAHGNTALEGFPRVILMYGLLSEAGAGCRANSPGGPRAVVEWKYIAGDFGMP